MFDIGWTELLLIGIVALIVVGPKDLPVMFKTLGRFTAKMRNMAREFQRAMESAADETGVKDIAGDLKKAVDPKAMGVDALKDAAAKFEAWDPSRSPRRGAAAATTTATAAAATPAAATGPATAALAEERAARATATAETAAALRAGRDGEAKADT